MATSVVEPQESLDPNGRQDDFVNVQCNWQVKTDKQIRDTVSTIHSTQISERKLGVDDVVNLNSCVALFPSDEDYEPCMIEIKLTNNLKITRVVVVSEAAVLEFYKQCGEYSSTQFAEFVDEFEDHSVYIGEATISPSSEASVKFLKTKRIHPEMWLYGIKLVVTNIQEEKEKSPSVFNFDVISRVLSSFALHKDSGPPKFETLVGKLVPNSEPHSSREITEVKQTTVEMQPVKQDDELKKYIDGKLKEMETRLTKKIEDTEERINSKLDSILAILK